VRELLKSVMKSGDGVHAHEIRSAMMPNMVGQSEGEWWCRMWCEGEIDVRLKLYRDTNINSLQSAEVDVSNLQGTWMPLSSSRDPQEDCSLVQAVSPRRLLIDH
jgi:hypothetical protein